LKPMYLSCPRNCILSPPARGRGLKRVLLRLIRQHGPLVAPCAGAWIETEKEISWTLKTSSRPLRGGVD